MPPPKIIFRFAIIFTATYALLMTPTFGLAPRYAVWFRTTGSATLAPFLLWPQASVHFFDLQSPTLREDVANIVNIENPNDRPRIAQQLRFPPSEEEKDTLLVLQNRNALGSIGLLRTSSRLIGLTPIVLFAALAVATPLPWRRLLFVLLLGLVAVHAFIVFRLSILVTKGGFAVAEKRYHLFEPSDFWKDLLARANTVLCTDPTFNYVAPVFFWVVLLFAVNWWGTWRSTRHAAKRPS